MYHWSSTRRGEGIGVRRYSHTAIKLWQRCQRKWAYKYIDRLETDATKPALERGKTLHQGLEYYHTEDPLFAEWYEFAEQEDRDVMDRYALKYDEEEWEVLFAEQEIEFSLHGYTIVVIPDLVVRLPNGEVWIVDHKTTSRIPDEWDEYNMSDFQHLLYIAALQQAGYDVAGFIFNYIRTKPPTVPQTTKDGSRFANLARMDTDYGTLYKVAERLGWLENEDVKNKLNVLKHGPDKYFQRHYLIKNQHAVDQAVKSALATMSNMSDKEYGRARGPYERHVLSSGHGWSACRNCEYQPLCYNELLGIESDLELLGYVEREKHDRS